MFPYTDPMRLMQTWCDAATAMTRANMATCEAFNSQMTSFWTGAMPRAQTRPATWMDQWSALTTPQISPFMPFAPATFAPAMLPTPAPAMTNPWMTAGWGMPGPFGSMFASMTEAMLRPALGFGEPPPPHQPETRDQRQASPFDVSYRGAGGHAVAPSIKFSAEVPVTTLAAMASVWAWPWATGRCA